MQSTLLRLCVHGKEDATFTPGIPIYEMLWGMGGLVDGWFS